MRYSIPVFILCMMIASSSSASANIVEAATASQSQLALLNNALQELFGIKIGGQKTVPHEDEVSLRKKVLLQILDLSRQDVRDAERVLTTTQRSAPDFGEEINALRAPLSHARIIYDDIGRFIITRASLEELKQDAQTLLDARRAVQNHINYFSIISAGLMNRDAIAIAEARLQKVTFDVRSLENFQILERGRFDEPLLRATRSVTDARRIQDKLEIILRNAFIEEQIVENGEINPPSPMMFYPTKFDGEKIQTMLAQSLEELRNAYLIFIEIARSIQTTIR